MTQKIDSLMVNGTVGMMLFKREAFVLPEFRMYIDTEASNALVVNMGRMSLRIFNLNGSCLGDSREIKLGDYTDSDDSWYTFYACYEECRLMADQWRYTSSHWSIDHILSELDTIKTHDAMIFVFWQLLKVWQKALDLESVLFNFGFK